MKLEDVIRPQYRAARNAAISNDAPLAISALTNLSKTLKSQYEAKNSDTIRTKSELLYWSLEFAKYADVVRTHGLQDARVQRLFGLYQAPVSAPVPPIFGSAATHPAGQGNSDAKAPGWDLVDLISDDPKEADKPGASTEGPATLHELGGELSAAEAEDSAELLPGEGTSLPASAEGSEESDSEVTPCYDPDSLRSFIGQQHIVKPLLKEIAIAKKEGRQHLDNILLLGNPGLGKTTLMRLIAKELGVQFELLDCSQFRNSQQSLKALQNFFLRVAKLNAPVVIALDEVHMLTTELQSSLLTLLNDRVYVSPLDLNGQCQRIPIEEFTFIAATTDDDKVLETIKNRCLRLKFQLVDYSEDELVRIYRNKFAAKGLTATDEAIALCVPRSRGAIRYVNAIVDGLNSALYNDDGERISTHISDEVARNYFAEKGIDPIGLEAKDLEILHAIANAHDGVISAEVLSAQVGLDPKKYLSEYERYLIKIGFVTVSGRGRSLSDKALKYLFQNENKSHEDNEEG